MKLTSKQSTLLYNHENGNISIFKEELNKLNKKELIDFIYNVQEQSILKANIILSICYKYIE